MRTVVLLHQREILHYRVAVYNRLADILRRQQWRLVVLAQCVAADCPYSIDFELIVVARRTRRIVRALKAASADAVILFVNASEPYLFPVLFWLKWQKVPAIYWGHGIDLEDKHSKIKGLIYRIEQSLCDAIIVYAEQLVKYLAPRHRQKTFVARNTIDTSLLRASGKPRDQVLLEHGIATRKNVICVGRMQRRKRIGDLVQAFNQLASEEYGLILVGPDPENCLENVHGKRIYKLGPRYGVELADILASSDVYCMPGHVGLGIVDAMYFGLPFVTEDVDHAPEIMYLKDGINGFMVPAGDVNALADKLRLLLKDDQLRGTMARAAREMIASEATIDRMSEGFVSALQYVASDRNGRAAA